MLLLLRILTNDSMDDSLEDVLLWHDTLHIFDEIVSVVYLLIFEIVNHEIESSLWDHIDEGWEDL